MGSRRLGLVLVLLCASLAVLVLSGSASALGVHTFSGSFGEEGAGAGQLKEPVDVATNDTTHDVYVVDTGNKRVEEFSSVGTYIGQFAPPGGFKALQPNDPIPNAIAIDNSSDPLDPSAGDVYVADAYNRVVDKFTSTGTYIGQLAPPEARLVDNVAVDLTGKLFVSVIRPSDGGRRLAQYSNTEINLFESVTKFEASAAAINSEGSQYQVITGEGGGYQGHTGSGGPINYRKVEGKVSDLAIDTSNNVIYIAAGEQVAAYGVKNNLIEQFGSGHLTGTSGIAVDSSSHSVYVVDKATDHIDVFGQLILPDVETGEEPTNERHEGSVTLDGTVDPDGLPVTSCVFEYGTEASYGTTVPCEPSPGSGSAPVGVHADISGLTPLTLYHYRLVAGNANGSNPGIDRTFTAPTRPVVSGESVFDVSAGSATFSGRVNPGGADTTYRFEYGTSTAYGESVSGDAGSGAGNVEVTAHPQDLAAGTMYHYRLVAENPVGTVVGEEHTFISQRAPGKSELLDGRAWEMVSPPNKQGAALGLPGGEDLIESGADGNELTYVASGPTESQPLGNRAPEAVQVFSGRGSDSWSSRVIATPHDASHVPATLSQNSEYELFSSDLSLGLVEAQGATPLSEETSEPTPYLRHDTVCEADPQGCYQPLVTAANTAPGTKFGNLTNTYGFDSEVAIAGASSDLSHVVLYSKVPLTSGGSPGLYEWAEGKLTFLADMELGGAVSRRTVVRHAVSDDGSRVIGTRIISSEGQELLMRDVPAESTIRVDVSEPGSAGGKGKPRFQDASSDGSRVFFTDSARLTTDSSASENAPDLYKFDVETGKLSDLSVDRHAGEHADVLGQAIGASEDGSYIYFVANGVLAQGAVPGNCGVSSVSPAEATCNLYMSHEGVTTFIASLSGEDEHTYAGSLGDLTARVSPDGMWLAFMSDKSVTGYDNRDSRTGAPAEEVFLYDASTGRVVCVSCEPTGARPTGMYVTASTEPGAVQPLINNNAMWDRITLAATVPGWTRPSAGNAVYQARYLSDSGRLFFNSDGALVPQDSDGTWDVYEYEPAGAGSCEADIAAFVRAVDGCVGLISSGGSAEESVFLDASENGNSVFFTTGAGLLPQDYDGARDIYDARACSALSPCLPVVAVAPPPCATGDACKAAPTPQPLIFGSPPSETFSGVGNISTMSTVQGVRSRSLTRAQKLLLALKACHKKKSGRVLCERRARKQYGKAGVKDKGVSRGQGAKRGKA